MFDISAVMMQKCIDRLIEGYFQTFGNAQPSTLCNRHIELLHQVATLTLTKIAASDAPYHDVEHTILVTLTGQEILRGKQRLEGNVTPDDWVHFILGLLCHDIGYVKGVCQGDRLAEQQFITGKTDNFVVLPVGATDASLTPYHVDRSQQFVDEHFAEHSFVACDRIKHHIELTRFPAPADELHQDTCHYPGLTRAADLIGQLSDPRYLQKIPALFYEFLETGVNKHFGYRHPGDLRAEYPRFYRQGVLPLIQEALIYLEATPEGRDIIWNLDANLRMAECDRPTVAA